MMTAQLHSRFTDEVFCTPAPTTSQINVKTVDVLRDEIFSSHHCEEFRQGLYSAEELKSAELYEKYPPNFKDRNKCFIFSLLNNEHKYVPSSNKSILITRWKPFIPIIESKNLSSTKVHYQSDIFDYKFKDNNQSVEWYLNFANSDLFAYYGGPLLAQDELQVLECVELAALREYIIQTINTVGSNTVGSDAHTNKPVPTPILISNTERVIDLDTQHIYGNAFTSANEEELEKAFKSIEPPQIVNLIAIEALSYGKGYYTYEQVYYILATCYTGFKAAQILANKTHTMNSNRSSSNERHSTNSSADTFRTIIHTGWWGCGAYGNNRQMILITQILAAHWAEIDEIIFHTQTDEYQNDIDQAEKVVQKLMHDKEVKEVIEEIVKLNLKWGKSNNT